MPPPPAYAEATNKIRRVFIFKQISAPVESYDYVGDVYVGCSNDKSPSGLVMAALDKAKYIYMQPQYVQCAQCHLYESGKALRITSRATLLEIKRAFSNYWTAPPGRIYLDDIDAMIPIMGKADISDIQNEIVILVSEGQSSSGQQRGGQQHPQISWRQ